MHNREKELVTIHGFRKIFRLNRKHILQKLLRIYRLLAKKAKLKVPEILKNGTSYQFFISMYLSKGSVYD